MESHVIKKVYILTLSTLILSTHTNAITGATKVRPKPILLANNHHVIYRFIYKTAKESSLSSSNFKTSSFRKDLWALMGNSDFLQLPCSSGSYATIVLLYSQWQPQNRGMYCGTNFTCNKMARQRMCVCTRTRLLDIHINPRKWYILKFSREKNPTLLKFPQTNLGCVCIAAGSYSKREMLTLKTKPVLFY